VAPARRGGEQPTAAPIDAAAERALLADVGDDGPMRIRALSVFEGVVYHCWPVDRTNPCRPTLEVDALLREGDADATSGPLLVTVADYIAMVGNIETARPCLAELQAKGRIVQRLGADHISFPTWTRVTTAADETDRSGPARD
jgi:hypothetical protein